MVDANSLADLDLSCLLSSTFSIVSITVNVTVSAATIFGNILILYSIYQYSRYFKGSLYMFIANLAAADLLLGLWLLLFIYEEIDSEVKQNWYFCVAKPIGIVISFSGSLLSLIGISFDRFMAIIYPMKHFVQTHKRKFFVAYLTVIWIISIICGSLPIVLSNLEPHENTFICRLAAVFPRDFVLASSIGLIVAILINLILYGIVIWKIKTKETPGSTTGRKKRTKTVLMITVFVIFVVCWLPFIICSFLMQADIVPSTFRNVVCAQEYAAKLGFVNSALNWVIYGLANRKFRKVFRNILCCPFVCKQVSLSTEGSRAMSTSNQNESSVRSEQSETSM